jgi:hypothetical protein
MGGGGYANRDSQGRDMQYSQRSSQSSSQYSSRGGYQSQSQQQYSSYQSRSYGGPPPPFPMPQPGFRGPPAYPQQGYQQPPYMGPPYGQQPQRPAGPVAAPEVNNAVYDLLSQLPGGSQYVRQNQPPPSRRGGNLGWNRNVGRGRGG